ncbi:Major Facilitator Superfamily protein [Aspergillus niger]|uniref:Major Facilitator Superfamily protein n=1 Tax=Aspergillus niger TaxID=5061 RepID=A0A505HXU6_ASPNG|nr:Major Facilitator Superfamily protein [Aspergillus niger]
MPPSPLYTPQDVPSFKKRRNRLPNTRAKQLLRAAERDYNDPPPPPGLGECCGSSCDPCVNDLWKEELAIWRERWGDGAVEDGGKKEDDQGDESEGCAKMKMPGSWEWRPRETPQPPKAERFALVLGDPELLQLARWVCTIETACSCPMDVEYAKDSLTNALFIVQARPETVHSRRDATVAFKMYNIDHKGRTLTTGLAVGDAALSVRLCLIEPAYEMDKFINACVLVTATTDPDRVPIMERAAAIITDYGGRTSHAAIVANSAFLPSWTPGSAQGRVWAADYVMCEILPSAVLAEQFAAHFDGFLIWSTDLEQLIWGNDHDSDELGELFYEQGEATKTLVAQVARVARRAGCKVGICG